MGRLLSVIVFLVFPVSLLPGQKISVRDNSGENKIDVLIDGMLFTSLRISQEFEKPFLFPVIAPDGTTVTRGYPVEPRSGERVDHPHHTGLWFNHGCVNGLDFWNNSASVPAGEKSKYGHIAVVKTGKISGGKKGIINVESWWMDSSGKTILDENTTWIFSVQNNIRIIDHKTVLSATAGDITFSDSKEGLFAIRVARMLEMPSDEPLIFTDDKGKATEVRVLDNTGVTGQYRSSNGKTGDEVWGTRNKWVILTGKGEKGIESLAIFDFPDNPGYPAYSHARGYGLFSVNNFGRRSYDPRQEPFAFTIPSGKSVTLVHRFCVKSGSGITVSEAENIMEMFYKQYN
ncbi:MAG TPA: PmoA family protein [Bacteroidales bacterium]|nr:PmoA family protein [Bacteroidales bacterium]